MTFRVVVIGGGHRGREHAECIRRIDGFQLAGVVGRASSPGAVTALGEVSDLDSIDIAVVATRPAVRSAVVAEVLATTGTRVIVAEKPLALGRADARAMVEHCAAAGVLLFVGYHWRHTTSFRLVRDAVAGGRIGRLERFEGQSFGNLYHQGSHLIDACRWIAGEPVSWVMSRAEDDPELLSPLIGADLGWAPDPAHPAPAWMVHHLGQAGGVRAVLETGLLFARQPGAVDAWRQARLTVRGSDGMAEAWASGRARVIGPSGLEAEELCDEDRVLAGTIGLLTEVRDVLLGIPGAGADLADGAAGAEGVEVMAACLLSASSGRLVRLPRPDDAPAPGSSAPATAPSLSVIINLDDHRDTAAEAVASWRRAQGVDGPVELVLVSDGTSPSVDNELRRLLDAGDRLLVAAGSTRIALWDAGARAATGDVIVLTEAHCTAEPGCLAALAEALRHPRVHAAAGSAVPITTNALSRLDADINSRSEAVHLASTDWRLSSPHALAVRRSSYLEVGGYDAALDLYAEQALVASLRRAGRPVVHAPGARVRHRFADRPAQILATMGGLGRGQAVARTRAPADDFERALFPAGALDPMELRQGAAALAVLGALRAGVALRDTGRWLWPGLLPCRALIAVDTARIAVASARCRAWPDGPRLERAYLELGALAVRRARRSVLAELGPAARTGVDGPGRWPAPALDPGRWSGAHSPDAWEGQEFLWLEPMAGLLTDLPPGPWTMVLHTGGFGRDPRQANVRIRLNGRRLPKDAIAVGADRITIRPPARRIPPGRPQWWVIVTDPLEVPDGTDDRRLGLPVVAVEAVTD